MIFPVLFLQTYVKQTFNPKLTDEAGNELIQSYVKMRQVRIFPLFKLERLRGLRLGWFEGLKLVVGLVLFSLIIFQLVTCKVIEK